MRDRTQTCSSCYYYDEQLRNSEGSMGLCRADLPTAHAVAVPVQKEAPAGVRDAERKVTVEVQHMTLWRTVKGASDWCGNFRPAVADA